MNNPLIFTDPSGYRPEALFEEEERMQRSGGGNIWSDPFGWIMMGTSYMQQYIIDNSWSYNESSGTYVNHETGQSINPITNYQDYLSMVEPHIDRTAVISIERTVYIGGIAPMPDGSVYAPGKTFTYTFSNPIYAAKGGDEISYNQRVSEISLGIDISAGLVETAGKTTALQLGNGVKGVSAVSKIGRGAGTIGFVIAGVHAGYEYKTGNANTHTVIDLGVTALAATAVGVGVIVSSPIIITGAAIGGAAWGIYSLFGGGEAIDNKTNNWGRDQIFYRNK